jgi:hypothetical protein
MTDIPYPPASPPDKCERCPLEECEDYGTSDCPEYEEENEDEM